MKLVISDAHTGLKAAVRKVLKVEWQRCKVHFYRNVLVHVPKRSQARSERSDEGGVRAARREERQNESRRSGAAVSSRASPRRWRFSRPASMMC